MITTKTIINVTKRDIERAEKYALDNVSYPRDEFCPIALAAKRALKTKDVSVGCTSIWLHDSALQCELPPLAQNFIVQFDDAVDECCEKAVNIPKPITFEVECQVLGGK